MEEVDVCRELEERDGYILLTLRLTRTICRIFCVSYVTAVRSYVVLISVYLGMILYDSVAYNSMIWCCSSSY